MHSIHGRAPAIATGPQAGPPRAVGLGRHRRRRRARDRRQPLHPPDAAQRGPQDPAVQQPDLRAHQGAVLAHVGVRQADQDHAAGLDRPAVQSGRAGAGGRRHLRRPIGGRGPGAPGGRAAAGGAAPGDRVRGDLPELRHLQRRSLRPAHRPGDAGREPPPARARASRSSSGRSGPAGSGSVAPSRRWWPWARVASRRSDCAVHDAHAATSGTAFLISQLGPPGFPVPLGVFRAVETPTYDELSEELGRRARERSGPGKLEELLASGTTWTIQ